MLRLVLAKFLFIILLALVTPALALAAENDQFSNAILLVNESGQTTGNNSDATLEDGEPSYGYKSVWWKWQAPSSGPVSFNTSGSDFDTKLGVYTGTAINDLSVIGEDDNGGDSGGSSRVEFSAVQDEWYFIAITGYSEGDFGDIVLNWAPPLPPPPTTTISGLISLPQEVSPYPVEKYFSVFYMVWNSQYRYFEYPEYCENPTLSAGDTSTAYSCEVPEDGSQVAIYVNAYDDFTGIYSDNYYRPLSLGSTVWYEGGAQLLSTSDDHLNIDIPLLKSTTISGRVQTPNDITFTEDKQIYVWSRITEPISNQTFWFPSQQYTLSADSSYFDYTIKIPTGLQDAKVSYYIYDQIPGIYESGYYSTSRTVSKQASATPLDTSSDNPDINLTLLESITISGTLNLQDQDTFQKSNYVSLKLLDENSNYITGSSFQKTPNANSLAFSLAITSDTSPFTISYWSDDMLEYADTGYYKKDGDEVKITYCRSDATLLTVDDTLTGLDIPLPKQPSISGTISLPDGAAPIDIPIEIGTVFPDNNGQYNVANLRNFKKETIFSGDVSTSYSVRLNPGCESSAGAVVGYRQINNDYVRYGFYADDGTKGNPNNALPMTQDEAHRDINMHLMTGQTILGTIFVPAGTTPVNDLPVTLGTFAELEGIYHTTVTIPVNQQSVDYSVRLAPDIGNVALSYWLPEDVPLARRGFYRAANPLNHVTGRYDLADKTFSGGLTGMDFTLAEGNLVSGTIQIPEAVNHTVPIVVSLADNPVDPDSIYWHTAVNVTKGNTSATYSQRVILDSPAIAMFLNNHESTWIPKGFFKDPTQSVSQVAQATKIGAGQTLSETNLFVTPMLGGDINFDGKIDLTDVILSLQVLTNDSITNNEVTPRADVNGDNRLGMPETLYILKQVSAP